MQEIQNLEPGSLGDPGSHKERFIYEAYITPPGRVEPRTVPHRMLTNHFHVPHRSSANSVSSSS